MAHDMGVSKEATGGPGSGPLLMTRVKSFISFPYRKNPFISFHFLSFFDFSGHFNFMSCQIHFLSFISPFCSFSFPFILISWCFQFLLFLPFSSFLFIFLSFPFHFFSCPFMFFRFFLFSFHVNFIFPFLPNPDFWVLTCGP